MKNVMILALCVASLLAVIWVSLAAPAVPRLGQRPEPSVADRRFSADQSNHQAGLSPRPALDPAQAAPI